MPAQSILKIRNLTMIKKHDLLFYYLFLVFFCGCIADVTGQVLINGTTGTPLGGFGAGAVKFNANNGSFAAMTQPPADAYDFKKVSNAKLQFFSERGNTVKTVDILKANLIGGRPDDDAIWPLHRVNFGSINDVEVNLEGFSPLDTRDHDRMSLPYAFYEIRLKNMAKTGVTVSFAFQWDSDGQPFAAVPGKGIASKMWTVFAASPDAKAVISSGGDNDESFFKNGKCLSTVAGNVSKVAVKVDLSTGEAKTVRFVLAWYDDTDPEIAYYMNLGASSQAFAEIGLAQFDHLKSNAESLVNRMRASNLPGWLKNQTLNTLANISTNSMYKKDGRVAFAEGQWTCFGTMDQMWHARQIIGEFLPFYAWQELRYWARTQMKNGQIHHDFNKMDVGPAREKRSILAGWDDTEHTDYRNVDKWVDLNCALIISTYEVYQSTGDRKEFDFLWPYLKKAGKRILDQVDLYGSKVYPYTFDHSENSYDAGGNPDPFNANLSAVAYKIMTILSTEKKENELAARYQLAYQTVVKSFADRYLNEDGFRTGKHSESYYAGQWLALNLKLGEIWRAGQTDFVLKKLDSYYHPYFNGLGNEKGTYDEWMPYLLTHYAGLLLNTGRAEQWSVLQKDAYERQYRNRNLVFDHPLNILPELPEPKYIATNTNSGNQYISLPGIWRNYYDIIGYHYDLRTKALWLKPILTKEMGHQITNALFVSPGGYGTISCSESGKYFQNKDMLITTDEPAEISMLYFADNFGKNAAVSINGRAYPFKRIGTGYAKELAVKWNGKIDKNGVRILLTGDPGAPPPALPKKAATVISAVTASIVKMNAYEIIEAESAAKSAGTTIVSPANKDGYVTSCNNFDYIEFSDVDFGETGAVVFFAKVASKVKGSGIEIVLDNVAGEVAGSCQVPDTGGEESWASVSCTLKRIKGVHDVILRFVGTSSGNLMNINKVSFGNLKETTDPKWEK
jgi:hypothetical protein